MKKFLKIFLPALLCFSCLSMPASTVYADLFDDSYDETIATGEYYYVVDNANEINDDEALNSRLAELSDEYGINLVVLTVESIDGQNPETFAESFLNSYCGDDSAVFMLSMQYRDWAFPANGKALEAINDYGCNYIFDEMSDDLADDDFDSAFEIFTEQCDIFLKQAETGEPYSEDNPLIGVKNIMLLIVIAIVAGLIIAFIATMIMRSQLTSVRFQKNANTYIKNNSVNLTHSNDIFLYKTVSKTKISSSSSGSGGSGGGGSRSGKF